MSATSKEDRRRNRSTPDDILMNLLTDRQREVLVLIARGLSNKEIGQRLCISASTVEGHTFDIFNKLGVDHRGEASYRAYRSGLLDDVDDEEDPRNPL